MDDTSCKEFFFEAILPNKDISYGEIESDVMVISLWVYYVSQIIDRIFSFSKMKKFFLGEKKRIISSQIGMESFANNQNQQH